MTSATRDSTPATGVPGEHAGSPAGIPPAGWWQILRRGVAESGRDNVAMMAGGVAFFAFLAAFPALIATVTVYGLVADPARVDEQVGSLAGALPRSAQPLLTEQLAALTSSAGGALSLGLVVSLLAAVWSASSGTANLMQAVNLAYDEQEGRGFLRLRGTALLLTLCAIVFVLVSLALVAVVPALIERWPLGVLGTVVAQVARWGLLVGLVTVALAVIYRIAPDRDAPRMRWASPGALLATALWVAGSALFSLYVNNLGSYDATYGALAGVVVLMLWLYLTSYVVLLGAEINAESERQTRVDTTRGEPEPMGSRGAAAADEVAPADPGTSG